MEAVKIVTVKDILPLFKGKENAENVELITFKELGFEVVSRKNLYKKEDKAIFILPDYCVSDIDLFKDFIAPNGDKSRSYLGNVNGEPRRIRAKKFSLHKGDGTSIYSNGILLSYYLVSEYLGDTDLNSKDLTIKLGITKYEEPEEINSKNEKYKSYEKLNFPSGIYKTDETNINMLWEAIRFPIKLIGTQKVDGSSISIGITNDHPEGFIASRNVNIPIYVNKFTHRRNKTWIEKILFWTNPDLNVYTKQVNDNIFVKAGIDYLKIMSIVGLNNIILRGELNGKESKGSGNKDNPSQKLPTNIQFFNIDEYNNGIAKKVSYDKFIKLCQAWSFPTVPLLFEKTFNSREEIERKCEEYFINHKKRTKEIIEGIVLKTTDSRFSCKYMNNEYDSRK